MTRTILVVDDEPRIVELARDYLEHAGFDVVTASDGPTALAAARDKAPDLVVLDRDILDPGSGPIGDARVLLTLVEGEAVYADPGLGW